MVKASKNPERFDRDALVEKIVRRTARNPTTAERTAIESRWLKNHLYYRGSCFLAWNSGQGRWDTTSDGMDLEYKANLIKPTISRIVAKLVGRIPTPRVAPETPETTDRNAARLGEQALSHLWDSRRFQKTLEEAMTSAAITGIGFIKTNWNEALGPPLRFYLDDKGKVITERLTDEQKAQHDAQRRYRDVNAGDVDIKYVSPFSIEIDPDAYGDCWKKRARWMCEMSLVRLSEVRLKYGAIADEVDAEADGSVRLVSEQLREESYGTPLLTTAEASRSDDDTEDPVCLFREYWERPTAEFPEGLRVLMAGHTILKVMPNKYASPDLGFDYPYVALRWSEEPERLWVDGLVEQLIPTQEEYNLTRSQMVANRKTMANPPWAIAKGSDVSLVQVDGLVGTILEYNGTMPRPEQVQPVALPPYVMDHMTMLVNEFQTIAADRDPANSQAPSSLRSGPVLSMLEERDKNTVANVVTNMLSAVQDVARMSLVLMGKFYDEPRLIKKAGDAFVYEVRSFLGADLRDNYDVRVFIEGGALESRAARQQTILDYVQLGILDPTNEDDKRKILQALEYGDPQTYITPKLVDERTAAWENEMLRAGQPVPVLPWQDHSVHIAALDLVMRSVAFHTYPEEVKQAFVQHRSQHDELLAEIVQSQLAAADAARGGSGGPRGKPSAPKRG